MTREAFIKVLKEQGYSYMIVGGKIVVTHNGNAHLSSLETLPPGVEFNNRGYVNLPSLQTIPPGVEFNNGGYVYLELLKTISPGVEFKNQGGVFFNSLETISPGVVFRNRWRVRSNSLFGGFLDGWKGNIEGIEPNELFNKMIKDGLFDRR